MSAHDELEALTQAEFDAITEVPVVEITFKCTSSRAHGYTATPIGWIAHCCGGGAPVVYVECPACDGFHAVSFSKVTPC